MRLEEAAYQGQLVRSNMLSSREQGTTRQRESRRIVRSGGRRRLVGRSHTRKCRPYLLIDGIPLPKDDVAPDQARNEGVEAALLSAIDFLLEKQQCLV